MPSKVVGYVKRIRIVVVVGIHVIFNVLHKNGFSLNFVQLHPTAEEEKVKWIFNENTESFFLVD